MEQGTKRKRDSSTPTLVYSAPGYPRFAKLFTETSLAEIKEIVRKRLQLSTVSDFTLFYDTDIALENDDDFDAFEVHAQSAGSVNVVVKVSSQPATNAGPSAISRSADPIILEGGNSPPRKKRKMATVTPDPTASISSAPREKKRKGNAPLVENKTVSAAPEVSSNELLEAPGGEQEPRKKKRKKNVATKDAESAQIAVPIEAAGANQVPDPPTGAQERPKKKSKKATDVDTAPKAPTSNVLEGVASTSEVVNVEDQRKPKSKKAPEQAPETAPPKSSVSKKSTKKSKKDTQTEDAPSAAKSVKFSLQDQSAGEPGAFPYQRQGSSLANGRSQHRHQESVRRANPMQILHRARKPEPKPGVEEFLSNWVQTKLTGAPAAAPESDFAPDKGVQPRAAKATKKSGQKASTEDPTPCPVCQNSPFHLRYRCPVVLDGPGPIRKRIAALQQDSRSDHSQLIQELHSLAEKGERASKRDDPKNVNAHSSILRPDAKKGGVSNPSVSIPGPELVASSSKDEGSSSSSGSDSELPTTRKVVPRQTDPYVDVELEAIIHGPGGPSRLTVDDIVFEEEPDEDIESVVLENDDDDLDFRRRSRQFAVAAASSDEEDNDEDDDRDSQAAAVAEAKDLPPINISAPADSRRSSTRSATEPLTAIHMRQSMDIDPIANKAVDDAMASDNVIFPTEGDVNSPIDPPNESARTTPIPPTPPKSPRRDKKASPHVLRFQTPENPAADDPIQPAEDFPPTPVQPNNASRPPLTPRMSQRMKDRNGKIPVKLSQLDPPFSLTTQTRTTSPKVADNDVVSEGPVDEGTSSQRTRTRSSTRSSVPPPSEVQQPAKRRRAPNKTPEQRAEEAAAKLAAKEEREKLRKEKAEAKAAAKKGGATKKGANSLPTDADSSRATPPSKPLPDLAASAEEQSELCTPMPPPPTSRTPMSQDEWTVLQSTSPHEGEEYRDVGSMSMRDELRSSSPEPTNDGDQEEDGEGPLFLPAESQVPFPYSQWTNSIPDGYCPGSPKNSGDEDEEEEVAASMKSSQRPSTYRRLTDITSQPSSRLFSTPTLPGAAFPPATFPRTNLKDKRDELYGAAPKEDDDSSDSDSSSGDTPSHIPKSRRAGMATR
ncbi:hypothetical protein B0H17DRAFT_1041415 [Mycena rosella]|uniref:Uncharacterized protein n=1 Tax=Mycena rosella TaxID=1033263 RepID=A0AAD7DZ08_MYCRO|nr:hypothetical protein B0H17DRAFT_1041415 [Mycena rosella]